MSDKASVSTHDCYCPLNCYKRMDYHLEKQEVLPHYPKNIKTIYDKDYKPYDANAVARDNRQLPSSNPWADRAAYSKGQMIPGAYRTFYKMEYPEKKAQPDHRDE
jgi:hypothetical protein